MCFAQLECLKSYIHIHGKPARFKGSRAVQGPVPSRQPAANLSAYGLLEGRSGAEAAAQLKMLVATVYTAKSKVQRLVREEIQRLEAAGGAIS